MTPWGQNSTLPLHAHTGVFWWAPLGFLEVGRGPRREPSMRTLFSLLSRVSPVLLASKVNKARRENL